MLVSPSRRLVRVLLVGTLAGVALIGSLMSPLRTTLLIAPAVGGVVAGLVALENLDFPARPSARRMVLCAGVGGALLVPVVAGILWLSAAGAVITVVLIGLGVSLSLPTHRDRGATTRRSTHPGRCPVDR